MNNVYDDDDDIDPYLNGPPPLVRGIGVNYAVNNPVDNDNPVNGEYVEGEGDPNKAVGASGGRRRRRRRKSRRKSEEKVEEEEVVDVAIK